MLKAFIHITFLFVLGIFVYNQVAPEALCEKFSVSEENSDDSDDDLEDKEIDDDKCEVDLFSFFVLEANIDTQKNPFIARLVSKFDLSFKACLDAETPPPELSI